jgi:hypothetical protein
MQSTTLLHWRLLGSAAAAPDVGLRWAAPLPWQPAPPTLHVSRYLTGTGAPSRNIPGSLRRRRCTCRATSREPVRPPATSLAACAADAARVALPHGHRCALPQHPWQPAPPTLHVSRYLTGTGTPSRNIPGSLRRRRCTCRATSRAPVRPPATSLAACAADAARVALPHGHPCTPRTGSPRMGSRGVDAASQQCELGSRTQWACEQGWSRYSSTGQPQRTHGSSEPPPGFTPPRFT